MKRNYQKELDQIIGKQRETGEAPTLLLHSCCAPCSSYCLEYLSHYFSILLFYYNPNISPEEEYRRRVSEQKRLIALLDPAYPITFLEGRYEPEVYFSLVKGLEDEPEQGKRCEVCFRMRLREAAKAAKEKGADYFTTTLSISPLKNAELLNALGEEIGAAEGVAYLPSDFKKKNGYQRSVELSKEYGLYRQDFCGCIFSKAERERQKNKKERNDYNGTALGRPFYKGDGPVSI